MILYTGGTIGMDVGTDRALTTPRLKPSMLKQRLEARVPELSALADCHVEVLLNRDSAHVGPEQWKWFAQEIQSRWSQYDGVVLLHGTDTLAYTASALSFLLRPCLRPVVITGAQRPLTALRTDARRNLISAVEIATQGPRELVSQVCVFFDEKLFRGDSIRKRSAIDFDAFESPQVEPLAVVGTEIRYQGGLTLRTAPKTRLKAPLKFLPEFDRQVVLLHVTPGFPARLIREKLLPDLSALVLVVFQSGTAPTEDPEFLNLLEDARRLKKPVVLTTDGRASHPDLYEAGKVLLREGGIWAGTMTPECAFVKTAWILGQPGGARRFTALWKAVF